MTEKQMTDEELAEKIVQLYDERRHQIIPASVSVQQKHYRHTVKMIANLIAESRKGMFTEEDIRLCAWDAIEDTNHDKFDSWFKQWLTKRKGR